MATLRTRDMEVTHTTHKAQGKRRREATQWKQLNDIANKASALTVRLREMGWNVFASDVELIQEAAEHQLEKIVAEQEG